jgi:DNA-binding transcriptional MerR regulator
MGSDANMSYTIGEFSKKLGVSGSTIKNYEKKFNIEIVRNSKGHRMYTENQLGLFQLILRMKNMGATLDVIHKILIQKELVGEVSLEINENYSDEKEISEIEQVEVIKDIAVIDYNSSEIQKIEEKRYSIEEVTQLTANLKEIQDNYIMSLKEQVEQKDRQIAYYENQIQRGQELLSKVQELLDYEVDNNRHLQSKLNTLEQNLIAEKSDQIEKAENQNKLGIWSKFKKVLFNR